MINLYIKNRLNIKFFFTEKLKKSVELINTRIFKGKLKNIYLIKNLIKTNNEFGKQCFIFA